MNKSVEYLQNNKYKKVLMELEAMTRNPREYEPSYYTINHIIREILSISYCWKCKKEVNLNNDKYYFFEPTEKVLCITCCNEEGIDENGNRKYE